MLHTMGFHNKSSQLSALRDKLTQAKILPLEIISGDDFFVNKERAILKLQSKFPEQKVIIRSSSFQEDTDQMSQAGKFLSVLDVDSTDSIALKKAVENVFSSYGTIESSDEVLIQPMLSDILLSGVAFTCDINTGAPYYVINYSQDGSTSAVTSGKINGLKTFIAYKYKLEHIQEQFMTALIHALCELEIVCDNNYLDVEFAITKSNEIYIFQVRPITHWDGFKMTGINLDVPLNMLYQEVNDLLLCPHPFLSGDITCYSVMSDLNPAEILGVRPKKLAISLFKEFFTDNVWASKRNDYAYMDLTSHPAMVSFCGIPYIDVRVVLNSFIPQELNKKIADKLVNYYIQKLRNYPSYHDNIEFEIVQSCYYLGLKEHLQELLQYGFSDSEINEIEFSLLKLTNSVIQPEHGKYKKDIDEADKLIDKHENIMNSSFSFINKIYWLIEECKKHGTLPYTGVARAAFIAVQFLRSFVDCNIITNREYNEFMGSLRTVNRQMDQYYYSLKQGEINKTDFLKKYGHIRPNTYDILSPRYDEAFNMYFRETGEISALSCHISLNNSFIFNSEQKERIQTELDKAGLCLSSEQLIIFIREAIEGREYVKFIFTRSVSEILRLIKQLGERMKIPLEDIAHLDIGVFKQLYADLYYDNLGEIIKQNIVMNKRQYDYTKVLKLPDLIRFPKDVYSFYELESKPNFITMETISGETVSENILNADLKNKVVFIPAADPGYDFLFTENIKGLITEYGGANSHMAIRCAEMGIPSVIGAGAEYHRWKQQRWLTIDCLNHRVFGNEF